MIEDAFAEDEQREKRVFGVFVKDKISDLTQYSDEFPEPKVNSVSSMKASDADEVYENNLCVSPQLLGYTVRKSMIRIIHTQTGEKSLLKGHQSPIRDMRFSHEPPVGSSSVTLCSVDEGGNSSGNHIFVWKFDNLAQPEVVTQLKLNACFVIPFRLFSTTWLIASNVGQPAFGVFDQNSVNSLESYSDLPCHVFLDRNSVILGTLYAHFKLIYEDVTISQDNRNIALAVKKLDRYFIQTYFLANTESQIVEKLSICEFNLKSVLYTPWGLSAASTERDNIVLKLYGYEQVPLQTILLSLPISLNFASSKSFLGVNGDDPLRLKSSVRLSLPSHRLMIVSRRGSSLAACLHFSASPIIPSLMPIRHASLVQLREPVTCLGSDVILGQDHHSDSAKHLLEIVCCQSSGELLEVKQYHLALDSLVQSECDLVLPENDIEKVDDKVEENVLEKNPQLSSFPLDKNILNDLFYANNVNVKSPSNTSNANTANSVNTGASLLKMLKSPKNMFEDTFDKLVPDSKDFNDKKDMKESKESKESKDSSNKNISKQYGEYKQSKNTQDYSENIQIAQRLEDAFDRLISDSKEFKEGREVKDILQKTSPEPQTGSLAISATLKEKLVTLVPASNIALEDILSTFNVPAPVLNSVANIEDVNGSKDKLKESIPIEYGQDVIRDLLKEVRELTLSQRETKASLSATQELLKASLKASEFSLRADNNIKETLSSHHQLISNSLGGISNNLKSGLSSISNTVSSLNESRESTKNKKELTQEFLKSWSDQLSARLLNEVKEEVSRSICRQLPEAVSASVKEEVKQSLTLSFKHAFGTTLLPAFETGLQKMMIQVRESFSAGLDSMAEREKSLQLSLSQQHTLILSLQSEIKELREAVAGLENSNRNRENEIQPLVQETPLSLLLSGRTSEALVCALEFKDVRKLVELLSHVVDPEQIMACEEGLQLCAIQQLAADFAVNSPMEGTAKRLEWLKNLVIHFITKPKDEANFKIILVNILESLRAARIRIGHSEANSEEEVSPASLTDLNLVIAIISRCI